MQSQQSHPDMTVFETASVARLTQLSEGDSVAVRYDSPYSDDRKTLEGTVTRTETEQRDGTGFTKVTIYIAPEEEDHRQERYQENLNRPPRRIDGYGDGDMNTFALETRNGARWHTLTKGTTPQIKIVESTEGDDNA